MSMGFGIVGCGMIANFHARAVGDIRGASVVACYDTVAAAFPAALIDSESRALVNQMTQNLTSQGM